MEDRTRYSVGEHIIHAAFGTGLVVEVRDRGFYDVIEVAFQDGVRRLTSIHPDIVGRAGDGLPDDGALPADAGNGAATESATPLVGETVGKAKKRAASLLPGWAGFQSAVLTLDPGFKRLLRRAENGKLDPHREARLKLKAEELAARIDPGEIMAFDLARDVQRYPHQEEACRRALCEMRGRALLADEVGLGKTVEAGVIVSELMLRGQVKRALVLVPSSLQSQWCEELRLKFGMKFHVRKRGEDFSRFNMLISTLDTARVKRNQEQILKQPFDIVIIDEAHRLKNHRTLSYEFASAISSRFLLLLTATPVHNDLRELYNLVTLLRPGTLDTYSTFRKKYVARGDKRLPKNTGELADRLGQVMVRTRREDTNIEFSAREAINVSLEPTPLERQLYDNVSQFVRDAYASDVLTASSGWHLALMTLQKEIGSSPAAAAPTLVRLAAKCPDTGWRDRVLGLAADADAIAAPAKLERLLSVARSSSDKLIVFTQFRGTVRFLARSLEDAGFSVSTFHGSLTDTQREDAIRRFRNDSQILLSTDAGGEGRNLQFCHEMVNFDLPWNPMKIEQRIGRIHRLGQERDVTVYNFTAEGTVEAYVLAILHQKLKMFELVVGELDMILGQLGESQSIEDIVFKVWTMNPRDTVEKEFERLGEDLENARMRYEMIDQLDRRIFESIRQGVD